MKKIYVCSDFSGEREKDVAKAREYCAFVSKFAGAIPIAPHIYFSQFLDDITPEEKTFDRLVSLELITECDELWYFGEKITKNMVTEIITAKENKIPVRYFSEREMDYTKITGGIIHEN